MIDYNALLQDPHPEWSDSALWRKLFRSTGLILPDVVTAEMMLRRLYTLRAVGTRIQRTHQETRFVPVLKPNGDWDNQEEFDEMKRKYLLPHAKEITKLLLSL